jgi:hypothetical protein
MAVSYQLIAKKSNFLLNCAMAATGGGVPLDLPLDGAFNQAFTTSGSQLPLCCSSEHLRCARRKFRITGKGTHAESRVAVAFGRQKVFSRLSRGGWRRQVSQLSLRLVAYINF